MNVIADKLKEVARMVAKVKYKWKRSPKETGKFRSFGTPSELRDWLMHENGESIGFLSNDSADFRNDNNTKQWSIWFTAHGRGNIRLKRKFEFDQVEEAKKFAEESYESLINSTDESLKSVKEAMLKIRESRGLK